MSTINPPIAMLRNLTFLYVILGGSAFAQAGGESTIHYELNGNVDDHIGTNCANLGDLDGDGVADFVVSNIDNAGNDGDLRIYSGATGNLLYFLDGYEARNHTLAGGYDLDGDGVPDFMIGTFRGPFVSDGMVRIFSGKTGGVMRTIEGPEIINHFGGAMLMVSDLNGDGEVDLVIQESLADNLPGDNVGAIHFYTKEGIRFRTIYGVGDTEFFGSALADMGDMNGDGMTDILVGTEGFDSDRGSVDLYSGADGVRLMHLVGEEQGDGFGQQLVPLDDLNEDGVRDFATSAWLKNRPNNPGRNEGSVYVISGADGQVLRQHWGSVANESFGYSMTGSGDVDGDGFADYLVASKADGNNRSGFVTLFSGKTGIPLDIYSTTVPGLAPEQELGRAMAMLDDFDADGRREVLICNPDGGSAAAVAGGAVFRYSFDPQISISSYTASAANGEVLSIDLDFPLSVANTNYKILVSAAGYGPITYGIPIPLSVDSFASQSYAGIYPFAVHSNMQSLLDAQGDATASVTIPSGLSPSLIGQSLYFAAIVEPVGQLPTMASSPLPLTILP